MKLERDGHAHLAGCQYNVQQRLSYEYHLKMLIHIEWANGRGLTEVTNHCNCRKHSNHDGFILHFEVRSAAEI